MAIHCSWSFNETSGICRHVAYGNTTNHKSQEDPEQNKNQDVIVIDDDERLMRGLVLTDHSYYLYFDSPQTDQNVARRVSKQMGSCIAWGIWVRF